MRLLIWVLVFSIPHAAAADAGVCSLSEVEAGLVESSSVYVTREADLDLPFRSAHLLHLMAKRDEKLCVLLSYSVDPSGAVSNVEVVRSSPAERVVHSVARRALHAFEHSPTMPEGRRLYYFFLYDLRELGYGDVW